MTVSITPAPDGSYVDVFVPITFRRLGGRKVIVAPPDAGGQSVASTAAHATLVKALARAFRWQHLLEDGRYATIAELADAERINRSYVSRTLRLSLLAPDIVESILNGTQPAALRLAMLEGPFPPDWTRQRERFGIVAATS